MSGSYYRYTEGFRSRGTAASVVYAEISRIEDEAGGTASNEEVFEAASDEDSPIHNEFTWDGPTAVRELGIHRAGQLRRAIEVVYADRPKEEARRVWVHVASDEKTGKGPYLRIDDVVKNRDDFKRAVEGLRRHLDGLMRSIRELEYAAKRSGNARAVRDIKPVVDAIVLARKSIPMFEDD